MKRNRNSQSTIVWDAPSEPVTPPADVPAQPGESFGESEKMSLIVPLVVIGLVLWARQNLPVVTGSFLGVSVSVTVAQGLNACRTLSSAPGCADVLFWNNLYWVVGGTCALYFVYVLVGSRLKIAWR